MKNIFNTYYVKALTKPFLLTTIVGTMNILFFYRKNLRNIWLNCLSYFIKDKIPKKNILNYTEEYVEKSKNIFCDYQKKNLKDVNNNIEKEFYNQETYKETLEQDNNILELNWKKRVLIENTPRGNVYMFYDAYKLGFSYYSDTSSLPYHLLNAVAMKYCRIYKCMDFFIDQNIVAKEYESPLIKILHIEKKKNNEDVKKKNKKLMEDAPFIKYKNNTIDKSKNNKDKKKEKEKENIITNKFIAIGKVYNFNILHKKPKSHNSFKSNILDTIEKESSLQNYVMSYKEYREKLKY